MGAVADSTDLGPKDLDAGPAKQLSVSTMHSGLAEGVDQQNFEKGVMPALTSKLPAVHTNAVKESGEYAQGLSSSSTAERFGSSILEPSLTTGDALDKYQLVSEKLAGRPGSPKSLRQLVETVRNPAALSDLTVGKEDNSRHSRDRKQATGHSAISREECNIHVCLYSVEYGIRSRKI